MSTLLPTSTGSVYWIKPWLNRQKFVTTSTFHGFTHRVRQWTIPNNIWCQSYSFFLYFYSRLWQIADHNYLIQRVIAAGQRKHAVLLFQQSQKRILFTNRYGWLSRRSAYSLCLIQYFGKGKCITNYSCPVASFTHYIGLRVLQPPSPPNIHCNWTYWTLC